MCLLQHSRFLAYFIERFRFFFLLRDSENDLYVYQFSYFRFLREGFPVALSGSGPEAKTLRGQ